MHNFFAVVLALAATASAAVFTVDVGMGGFVYTPANTVANVGDVVTFRFSGAPGNHTVSQASFTAPCQQLPGGFDSDFVFIPTGFSGTPPEWNLTVTDTAKPIWFYCKQTLPTPHCLLGMVGSINAPSTGNTLAAFQAAAKALPSLPAQTLGSLTGAGAQASALPSPLTGGASQPPSASSLIANGTSSTATPGASSTAPSASSTPAHSSAVTLQAGSLLYLLAGLLGVLLV